MKRRTKSRRYENIFTLPTQKIWVHQHQTWEPDTEIFILFSFLFFTSHKLISFAKNTPKRMKFVVTRVMTCIFYIMKYTASRAGPEFR